MIVKVVVLIIPRAKPSSVIPTKLLFNRYFVIEARQKFSSQLSQIKITRTLFSGHGQLNLKPQFSHSISLQIINGGLLIGEGTLEMWYQVTLTITEIVVVRKECLIDMEERGQRFILVKSVTIGFFFLATVYFRLTDTLTEPSGTL